MTSERTHVASNTSATGASGMRHASSASVGPHSTTPISKLKP
jgi:hypothetical protein